jgi:hypothetical protein
VDTELTEVSGGWFAMWVVLVLTNLCAASIALEFGWGLCNVDSSAFPDMQVVLVMVLGVGLIAFYLVITKVLGSLGLLSRSQITSLPPALPLFLWIANSF